MDDRRTSSTIPGRTVPAWSVLLIGLAIIAAALVISAHFGSDKPSGTAVPGTAAGVTAAAAAEPYESASGKLSIDIDETLANRLLRQNLPENAPFSETELSFLDGSMEIRANIHPKQLLALADERGTELAGIARFGIERLPESVAMSGTVTDLGLSDGAPQLRLDTFEIGAVSLPVSLLSDLLTEAAAGVITDAAREHGMTLGDYNISEGLLHITLE